MQQAGQRAPEQAVANQQVPPVVLTDPQGFQQMLTGFGQQISYLHQKMAELTEIQSESDKNTKVHEGNHDNSRRVRSRVTSPDPAPAEYAVNRADKPQKPSDITQKSLQDARNNPESPDLGRQLGYVLSYVRMWGHRDEYGPMGVLQYVKDMAAKDFLDPLLRDLRTGWMMMPRPADHTPEDLHDPWSNTPAEKRVITALQQRVTGAVRSGEVIALQDLHDGRVKQAGSESVAAYTQRFMERVRMLPRESQSNLCMFFLSGLKPGLRVKCALDRDNHRWSDLMALTQYAYSEEERMLLTQSLFTHSRPPRSKDLNPAEREAWNRNGKRPRTEIAAAAGMDLDDDEGSLDISDITKCLAYDTATTKMNDLSPEAVADLYKYRLCRACRLSSAHKAEHCPAPRVREQDMDTYKRVQIDESRTARAGSFNQGGRSHGGRTGGGQGGRGRKDGGGRGGGGRGGRGGTDRQPAWQPPAGYVHK
jgi:hypothetical protein